MSGAFPPAGATEIPVIITGQTDGAPEGCTTDHVAGRLEDLFDDISSAEADVVPEYFGNFDGDHMRANTGVAFQWFCMAGTTVYDLPELDDYFTERYKDNEQIRLRSVDINGWDERRALVHFGLAVDRQDIGMGGDWQTLFGKGAYYCKNQTFHVLCLGSGE